MIINIMVFDLMQVKVEGWLYNAFNIMIMLAKAMIWNFPHYDYDGKAMLRNIRDWPTYWQ